MQVNDSECSSVELYVSSDKGHTLKASATFNGSILTGTINLVSLEFQIIMYRVPA